MQLRSVAHALGTHPTVCATDLLAPDVSPSGAWELELTLDGGCLPPDIAARLARHWLSIHDVSQRGEPTHTVVTVRPS